MNRKVVLNKLMGCVALAALVLLAKGVQAQSSPCTTWFSIPSVGGPAVCGDSRGTGTGFDGIPYSQTATPIVQMLSSSSVAVGATGTGNGGVGFALADGTYGSLRAQANANISPPRPPYYDRAFAAGRATIGYVDGFTITTTQTVRITSSISGSFIQPSTTSIPLGQGNVDFLLQQNGGPFIIYNTANSFIFAASPSIRYVQDFVLTPGDYSFRWSMIVDATATVSGGYFEAIADVRGRLFFDSMTPNATPITFLSGHSYVPEPDGSAMALAGSGLLALVGRRRFSA